jgi:hypothetical protein
VKEDDMDSDLTMQKQLALDQIKKMIGELEDCLEAANQVKAGIEAGDVAGMRKGLNRAIADHTDSYWHRLVLGDGTSEVLELIDLIENPEEAAA